MHVHRALPHRAVVFSLRSSIRAAIRGCLCAVVLLLAATGAGAHGSEPHGSAPHEPEPSAPSSADAAADDAPLAPVLRARMVDDASTIRGRRGHRAVRGIQVLVPDGGRFDLDPAGRQLVYERRDPETGLSAVWINDADAAGTARCLTCVRPEFDDAHIFDPQWHPSGRYVAVLVQLRGKRLRLRDLDHLTPDRGVHTTPWMIAVDGREIWQLIDDPSSSARLDLQLDFEGQRLLWAVRATNRRDRAPWGQWQLRWARLRLGGGVPRLGRLDDRAVASNDWQDRVRVHAVTPDDRAALVSAVTVAGATTADVWRVPFDDDRPPIQLTDSPAIDDGVALVVGATDLPAAASSDWPADGLRLLWANDRGLETPRWLPSRSDLWLRPLDRDGAPLSATEAVRLTYFNNPDADHARGEARIDDLAIMPNDGRLLLRVVWSEPAVSAAAGGLRTSSAIYRLRWQRDAATAGGRGR
ncbi:MAG: hypothetical protein AAF772_13735 [Acidobacteriota bacterium]